eukprot:423101_1
MSTILKSKIINIKNITKHSPKNRPKLTKLDLTLIPKPKAFTTANTFNDLKAFPNLTEKLAIIINELKNHDIYHHFFKPVSPEIQKKHKYNEKIKNPIHFNNILNNIDKIEFYGTFGDIMCDINLLWDNCYKFNGLPDPSLPELCGFSNFASKIEWILNQYIEAFKNELISKKYLSLHCENIKKNENKQLIHWKIQSKPSCINSVNIFNQVRCFPQLTCNITKIINHIKLTDVQGHFFEEITDLKYIKKVEHPIHFGQILQCIENEEYDTMGDIKTDIDLLFENCYVFNGKPIAQNAFSCFAKKCENILNGYLQEFEILLKNNGYIEQNKNVSGKKRNIDLNNVKITDMYIPIEPKLKKQKIV